MENPNTFAIVLTLIAILFMLISKMKHHRPKKSVANPLSIAYAFLCSFIVWFVVLPAGTITSAPALFMAVSSVTAAIFATTKDKENFKISSIIFYVSATVLVLILSWNELLRLYVS